jgi:hypothetical protein
MELILDFLEGITVLIISIVITVVIGPFIILYWTVREVYRQVRDRVDNF